MMLKVLVVLTAVCVGSIEARFGQISGSKFTAGKYDVFQIENKPYEFECTLTGKKTDIERSKISWMRPGLHGAEVPVQEGDPVVNVTETREDDKLVSTLHVPGPPEFNILQFYQCEVWPPPPDEINQHSFAIIGLKEKAVPKIQLRNKLEQARFKESVVLNCSVSYENSIANDYKLIMSWKKDGKLLAVENYEYKTGKITQPFQYTFVVRSHTDGGDYVCSWELKGDGIDSISRKSLVTLKILPFLAGPTMKEVSDKAGSDVKLKCDVIGYPIRFEWRDEEDNLINGSDSRFRPEEEVLHIDDIDYKDRQEYKCLGIGENETIVEQTIFLLVKDCHRKLSDPSDSFQSHPTSGGDMDPQSQYCSWLITIAETYVVSLNFKELTIPNCDDMFLKIYDGLNDTAPLLGTYCGSNATKEVRILSPANHLYIVSNSGRYGTNPKSPFSFHVQYNAEHAKGCHYEVMNNTGYFKSPKFATPSNYPHYSYCSWLVTVNDAHLIVLNFSLELYDNDVIEVYDGNNESATVLARYSPLYSDRKNVSLVSSTSMVYIILKYGKPRNDSTTFALNYISQPKPKTTDRNKESAKQSKSNPTTYIIVAVVVTVVVVLILIVIIIFFRRRKRKAEVSTTLHSINPSYTWRKQARANDEDSECYANPSSPQEKIWVGNAKVCKEGSNPIYEPAEGQEPAVLYTSTENTYEPLVGNQGRAVESENPLYGVGDIAASHVYAEPSSPPPNVYDEPNVKVSREARV